MAPENKQTRKLDHELAKISEAVKLLTIDPENKLNHKVELSHAAQQLDGTREGKFFADTKFNDLKEELGECQDMESVCQTIWSQLEARNFLNEFQNSEILEEMLKIGRAYVSGPFKTFPPDANRNLYADIVQFSLRHTPHTLNLLVNLIVNKDKPVATSDVVRVAHVLSSLAHSVNRENNAMAKLKSVLLQKEGLTHQGLDSILSAGITESSRSQRNVKDFFAGIANEVLKAAAQKYPHIRTMDNLDLTIADVAHHLTQEFIEVEQCCTKHLGKERKSFEETTEMFNKETFLLTSEQNQSSLDHYKKVVAITIGIILSKRVPGASFLKHFLDDHYDHPNQDLKPKPALLFIQKPLYLHEIKTDEMIEIAKEVQLDFLKLTAELVQDKVEFLEDLNLIQKEDCEVLVREAAEKRIHTAVIEAGEYIGNGDYLTWQKFYDAKRSLQSAVTALERMEYVKYFKVALFHMKMNKERLQY